METNVVLLLIKIQVENLLVLNSLGVVSSSVDLHLSKDKVSSDDYLKFLEFMRSKVGVTEKTFKLQTSDGFCHMFYVNDFRFLSVYRSS